MSFATERAANDVETLASWDGKDPLKVVLPLSVAAGWAYAPKANFEQVMQRRGLSAGEPELFEVVNDAMFVCAKAYVQPAGKGAIVAFRGTEPTNLINWLADATVKKVAFHAEGGAGAPNGYVHGGFYRNLRAVWPLVVEKLESLKPEWIYLTGHSFGAALALLAGALLSDYERKPRFNTLWGRTRGVVTFGQPMVGDQAFAAKYKDVVGGRLARFVFAHDIVPHLPPNTFGWAPVHFGTEYRADDSTHWARSAFTQTVRDALGANFLALGAWTVEQLGLPKLVMPFSWGDHAPNNYIRVSLPAKADSGSEFD